MKDIDRERKDESAMAIIGDFNFFAGKPCKELVLYKPKECKQNFIIMVPQNEEWAKLIGRSYGDKAKKVTRYAIKKEEKYACGAKLILECLNRKLYSSWDAQNKLSVALVRNWDITIIMII